MNFRKLTGKEWEFRFGSWILLGLFLVEVVYFTPPSFALIFFAVAFLIARYYEARIRTQQKQLDLLIEENRRN